MMSPIAPALRHVWFRWACYDKGSTVRLKSLIEMVGNNMSFLFTTLVLDEGDGALHPDRSQHYIFSLQNSF